MQLSTLKSVSKQQKTSMILSYLQDADGKKCLDIGGDNGVVSLSLREHGGGWSSADLEDEAVNSIRQLVGENVFKLNGRSTPFREKSFDVVVIVDFLEHITTDDLFITELYRIIKDEGLLIINVPHLRKRAILPALRNLIGMTDQEHGHVRPGYSLMMLDDLLKGKFRIECHSTYIRLFSELIDTAINFAWMKFTKNSPGRKGTLVTEDKLASNKKLFRLYSALYPLLWSISKIDGLLFFTRGASLIVKARKCES